MNEGRRRAPVVPRVPHEAARPRQDRRRVHGARRQLVAQLVAVVGQIADLEHEGDEIEGEKDDTGAHQAHEEVQLEVGLLPVGPRQRDVDEEAADGAVHEVGLEGEHQEAVPQRPEAVAVDVAALALVVGGQAGRRVHLAVRGRRETVQSVGG